MSFWSPMSLALVTAKTVPSPPLQMDGGVLVGLLQALKWTSSQRELSVRPSTGMTSNQRFCFRFSFWVFTAEWRMSTLQRQQTGQVTKPIDKKEARERFAVPFGCFISSPQRRPAGPQQHVRNKHRLALKQTARRLKCRVPYQRTSPCERRVRKHRE